jgi:RNA-directed DNA polymerase
VRKPTICSPDNIEAALQSVVRNKGAPGIDGVTVKQLPSLFKVRWSEIEEQLLPRRLKRTQRRISTESARREQFLLIEHLL